MRLFVSYFTASVSAPQLLKSEHFQRVSANVKLNVFLGFVRLSLAVNAPRQEMKNDVTHESMIINKSVILQLISFPVSVIIGIIGYVINASRRDDLGCFRWFGCEISSFSFCGFKNVVSSAGSCRSFLQKQKVWFLFASLEVSLPAALQKKRVSAV